MNNRFMKAKQKKNNGAKKFATFSKAIFFVQQRKHTYKNHIAEVLWPTKGNIQVDGNLPIAQ